MKHKVMAYLLQTPRIEIDGAEIKIRLRKAEALVYYLLIHRQASRMEITGLLWGDEPAEKAYRHLRDNLYYLKKELPVQLILPRGKTSLALNDEIEFHSDIDDFQNGSDVSAYRPDFLAGFSPGGSRAYEDWMEQMNSSLRDEYLSGLYHLVEKARDRGDSVAEEQALLQYLQEEPVSEKVAVALMELYRSQRDYHRAAMIYHRLHKAMGDWFGIVPLKETTALYYSIMDEWNRQAGDEDYRAEDFLIGRTELFRNLSTAFQKNPNIGASSPSFVLRGEAGVGKTHLLNYFLSHGDCGDYQIVAGSCFKSKQKAYLFPWQSIMITLSSLINRENIEIPVSYRRMAAILFPVFDFEGTVNPEKTDAIFQTAISSFESILTILSLISEKRSLLFVLEDIQWIDSVSLELLDQILHKISSERIAVAATCRCPADENVEIFLREAQENGRIRCYDLEPFTREEVMEFIDLYSSRTVRPEWREKVFYYSGGNAFLLVQLLESILERGELDLVPDSMEDIISYRLAGLDSEGQNMLDLIAMFSDYAPFSVLDYISNKTTLDLLYICQDLCRRAIIAQVHDGGNLSLVFTQAEFREIVYSRIAPIKRKILHLNIAKALTELPETSVPDWNKEIVYHYRQGGDRLSAFRYEVRGIKTYAYLNCAALLEELRPTRENMDVVPQSARMFAELEDELNILKEQYAGEQDLNKLETELLYAKGCLCIYRGDYDEGTQAIRRILCQPGLAAAEQELAHEQMLFYGIQTYRTDVMREHIWKSFELTRGRDDARYAVNRRYYGYLLVMEGKYAEGRRELQASIEMLEQAIPDSLQRELQIAYAHDYMGEAYRKQGLYQKAIREYDEAIELVRSKPSSTSLPAYYGNYASAAFAEGDYALARKCLKRAKEYTDQMREPAWYTQSILRLYEAIFSFVDGQYSDYTKRMAQGESLANMMATPYERGLIDLAKAFLRLHCQQEGLETEELTPLLSKPYIYYLESSKQLLEGKAGAFESLLQEELNRGEMSSVSGLWSR